MSEKIIIKQEEKKVSLTDLIRSAEEKISMQPKTKKGNETVNKYLMFVDSILKKETLATTNNLEFKNIVSELLNLDKTVYTKIGANCNTASTAVIVKAYSSINDYEQYNKLELTLTLNDLTKATSLYKQLFYSGYTSNLSLLSSNSWALDHYENNHMLVFTVKYIAPNNSKRDMLEHKNVQLCEKPLREEEADENAQEAEAILASFGYTLKDIGL